MAILDNYIMRNLANMSPLILVVEDLSGKIRTSGYRPYFKEGMTSTVLQSRPLLFRRIALEVNRMRPLGLGEVPLP